jgi:succinyl-CoA:acetate CoA-transferase
VDERIGTHAINIDPAKIVGIVINNDYTTLHQL